jgi:hypothetical protein
MEGQRLAGQRLLQHRLSTWPGVLSSLQHHSGRVHIRRQQGRRNATPNLRPPLLVKLDCLTFQLSRILASPDLSFTVLSDKQSGIVAANRHPADLIERDLDIPGSKEGSPAVNWRRQIQLEMAQRDGRLGRDHHVRGRLNNRGSAEHDLSPINQGIVCCVGEAGRAALKAPAERRIQLATLRSRDD